MTAEECRAGGKHCARERGAFDRDILAPAPWQKTVELPTAPLIEFLNAPSLAAVAGLLGCDVPELRRRYA